MSGTAQRRAVLLIGYAGQAPVAVAVLSLLLVIGLSLEIAAPAVVRAFIDGARTDGGLTGLVRLAALFLSLIVVAQLIRAVVRVGLERIAWRVCGGTYPSIRWAST